jgi:predicted O-methyltransferase YrrM
MSETLIIDTTSNTIKQLEDAMTGKQWIDYQLAQGEYISGKGIVDLVNEKYDEVIGCEVGVCLGVTSEYYMDNMKKLKKLYCIDNYPEYVDWTGFVVDREKQDAMKQHAYESLEKYKDRIEFVYESSTDFAKTINGETFDFVFIDADHSYEGALRDFESYYPIVKSGGLFSGHDFTLSGVNKALREFFKDKYSLIKQLENNAWYIIK